MNDLMTCWLLTMSWVSMNEWINEWLNDEWINDLLALDDELCLDELLLLHHDVDAGQIPQLLHRLCLDLINAQKIKKRTISNDKDFFFRNIHEFSNFLLMNV